MRTIPTALLALALLVPGCGGDDDEADDTADDDVGDDDVVAEGQVDRDIGGGFEYPPRDAHERAAGQLAGGLEGVADLGRRRFGVGRRR